MSNGEPTIRGDNMVAVTASMRADQRVRWESQQRDNDEFRKRLDDHGQQGDRIEKDVARLQGTCDTVLETMKAVMSRPRGNHRNGWQRPIVVGSGGAGVGALAYALAQLLAG